MRPSLKFKREEVKKLMLLVDNARASIDKTKCFLCKANVSAKLKNVHFLEYNADNFSITPCDEGFDFLFYVNAIDNFEAELRYFLIQCNQLLPLKYFYLFYFL